MLTPPFDAADADAMLMRYASAAISDADAYYLATPLLRHAAIDAAPCRRYDTILHDAYLRAMPPFTHVVYCRHETFSLIFALKRFLLLCFRRLMRDVIAYAVCRIVYAITPILPARTMATPCAMATPLRYAILLLPYAIVYAIICFC